jgi:hypothetical protein
MSFVVYVCGVSIKKLRNITSMSTFRPYYNIPWEGLFMNVNGYGYNVGYPVYAISLLCLHIEAEKIAWNSANNHGVSEISCI